MDEICEAQRVFDIEIEALKRTRMSLDGVFVDILKIITQCDGKLIITGIGKSGHIAAKLAATFASLGTPSFYLHPAEAQHGDLGMVSGKDVVMAISYSGESNEIINIMPSIKLIGAKIIAITGNGSSTLAGFSDIVQVLPAFDEACYLGLAPTSSTTAVLCYGDALAVVASIVYGFKEADFGKYHPAGVLGKKILLKVDDLMAKEADNPVICMDCFLKEAVVELSKKGMGMISVVDEAGKLQGIITDGDLRRLLEKQVNIYEMSVTEVMTQNPVTISVGELAIKALELMKQRNVSGVPVVDGERAVGALKLQSIINAGVM